MSDTSNENSCQLRHDRVAGARGLRFQTLLARTIFLFLMWALFMGTSARTCELQHVGTIFDKTFVAHIPLSFVFAIPWISAVILYLYLILRKAG
ncbi:MAG: hypothetical protein K2Y39_10330 [Candidatus Obscuribacterales bacterium]|nr:hypothetical protein [Candidatus Obscuribacterales bacterium]